MAQRTTPAMKRATENLKKSLAALQGCDFDDLQQRVHTNCLAPDHQAVFMSVIRSLHQLAEAEALRECGKQQDMFSGVDDREFAAWTRPMNQRTLF